MWLSSRRWTSKYQSGLPIVCNVEPCWSIRLEDVLPWVISHFCIFEGQTVTLWFEFHPESLPIASEERPTRRVPYCFFCWSMEILALNTIIWEDIREREMQTTVSVGIRDFMYSSVSSSHKKWQEICIGYFGLSRRGYLKPTPALRIWHKRIADGICGMGVMRHCFKVKSPAISGDP